MTNLSLAAQAILDAYGDFEAANVDAMAAALEAAKNQVAPHRHMPNSPMDWGEYNMTEIIRERLDAIVAELRAL